MELHIREQCECVTTNNLRFCLICDGSKYVEQWISEEKARTVLVNILSPKHSKKPKTLDELLEIFTDNERD